MDNHHSNSSSNNINKQICFHKKLQLQYLSNQNQSSSQKQKQRQRQKYKEEGINSHFFQNQLENNVKSSSINKKYHLSKEKNDYIKKNKDKINININIKSQHRTMHNSKTNHQYFITQNQYNNGKNNQKQWKNQGKIKLKTYTTKTTTIKNINGVYTSTSTSASPFTVNKTLHQNQSLNKSTTIKKNQYNQQKYKQLFSNQNHNKLRLYQPIGVKTTLTYQIKNYGNNSLLIERLLKERGWVNVKDTNTQEVNFIWGRGQTESIGNFNIMMNTYLSRTNGKQKDKLSSDQNFLNQNSNNLFPKNNKINNNNLNINTSSLYFSSSQSNTKPHMNKNKRQVKKICSKIPYNTQLTDKGKLYQNISSYCSKNSIKEYENFIPITFLFNFRDFSRNFNRDYRSQQKKNLLHSDKNQQRFLKNCKQFLEIFDYIHNNTSLSNTWIYKPTNLNQGRQIKLFNDYNTLIQILSEKKFGNGNNNKSLKKNSKGTQQDMNNNNNNKNSKAFNQIQQQQRKSIQAGIKLNRTNNTNINNNNQNYHRNKSSTHKLVNSTDLIEENQKHIQSSQKYYQQKNKSLNKEKKEFQIKFDFKLEKDQINIKNYHRKSSNNSNIHSLKIVKTNYNKQYSKQHQHQHEQQQQQDQEQIHFYSDNTLNRKNPTVQHLSQLMKNFLKSGQQFILQKYVQNPLLIQNRKFDIRIWVLLDQYGYLRFSSQKYELNKQNIHNNLIHLTNYAVQKKVLNKNYNEGNNLPLGSASASSSASTSNSISNKQVLQRINILQKWLKQTLKKEQAYQNIINQIKKIIKISLQATLKQLWLFNNTYNGNNIKMKSFQIFGYDFLIDRQLKVRLIQANTNPSINDQCRFLQDLITRMLNDAFLLTIDKYFYCQSQSSQKYYVDGYGVNQNMWQRLGNFKQI